ncbi:hypothetical protein AMTRI_Chr12g271790 [Amborella trichopoda]
MNVSFTLEKSELEEGFIKQGASEGMVSLKGHKSVGGVRASICNAMPLAGVQKLVAFMKEFKAKHASSDYFNYNYGLSDLTLFLYSGFSF